MEEDTQRVSSESHDEMLQDFKILLKAHREYINGLSRAEYREYKRRRRLLYEESTTPIAFTPSSVLEDWVGIRDDIKADRGKFIDNTKS
tara:strand:+ start:506 stop:772 length:267 start_codon:yes stop_codon:yes gene_type:complete